MRRYVPTMRTCLTSSVRLIANVSADGMELMGYTETAIIGTTSVDYTVRSTMVVCESVKGEALDALRASMQEGTYARALSSCLGGNATVMGSFTSPQSTDLPTPGPTRMPITWPTRSPTPVPTRRSPTPVPTQLSENGKKYTGTENYYLIRCVLLLYGICEP